MADANALAYFEAQKSQFAAGLHALAEHLRACAGQAEGFAQFVNASSIPNGQIVLDPNFIPNAQAAVNGVATALAAPGKPGRKRKNAALIDGVEATPGKRRRAVKEKDPDAPKRPASSYLLFQNDVRVQLREKHPEMAHHEIMTRISQLWAGLPAEEKEVYEKKHAGMKVDYETPAATPATAVATESDVESDVTPSSPLPAIATLPQSNGKLTNGHAAQPPAPAKKRAVQESESEEEEDEAVDDDEDEEESDEEQAPPKKKSKSTPAPVPVAAPVHKKRKNKD
ncbi:unnamed protein product [Peniophora sp. CBMAI 1063]|nr:unnamed protein product [Peniophora sp. CBMAI 1063]